MVEGSERVVIGTLGAGIVTGLRSLGESLYDRVRKGRDSHNIWIFLDKYGGMVGERYMKRNDEYDKDLESADQEIQAEL